MKTAGKCPGRFAARIVGKNPRASSGEIADRMLRSPEDSATLASNEQSQLMSYPSVDALQRILVENVFHYAIDKKKAAGRALGTLIEVITFYTLKSWGLRNNICIERPLSEYANAGISHNVEYSLHPVIQQTDLPLDKYALPLTAAKL